ncbi:hypothetical protein CVS40_11419 [Lucilia cuprina]|nr:hypothetical protein CVS40_11419 [Lucilia cuprina]
MYLSKQSEKKKINAHYTEYHNVIQENIKLI